jgi:hypothetical protein
MTIRTNVSKYADDTSQDISNKSIDVIEQRQHKDLPNSFK